MTTRCGTSCSTPLPTRRSPSPPRVRAALRLVTCAGVRGPALRRSVHCGTKERAFPPPAASSCATPSAPPWEPRRSSAPFSISATSTPRRPLRDYKALVCVFLYGGNDSNNLLVPPPAPTTPSTPPPAAPSPCRGLAPAAHPRASDGDGRTRVSIPASPVSRGSSPGTGWRSSPTSGRSSRRSPATQFLAGSVAAPPQLFSHSDQQVHWQTSIPDQPPRTGWGGRTADLLRTLNGNNQVSMSMSLAGSNALQVGDVVTQYQVSPMGRGLDALTDGSGGDPVSLAIRSLLARPTGNLMVSAAGDGTRRAFDNNSSLQALSAGTGLTTVFPDTDLGNQLLMIGQADLGARRPRSARQVFFCPPTATTPTATSSPPRTQASSWPISPPALDRLLQRDGRARPAEQRHHLHRLRLRPHLTPATAAAPTTAGAATRWSSAAPSTAATSTARCPPGVGRPRRLRRRVAGFPPPRSTSTRRLSPAGSGSAIADMATIFPI